MTRHLPLEGVANFRDFGDYAGKDGRRVRKGLLWRSAGQQAASDADLERIAALDLAVVIDLRTPMERAAAPSRRPASFNAKVVAGEHDSEDTWLELLKTSDLSEQSFTDYMLDYYRKAPFEHRHVDIYTQYFRHLAEADGPILVHCAAGKDRTGVIVALTHELLGVSDEDAITDYLLTNDPTRSEVRLKGVKEHMEGQAGRPISDDLVRLAMGVETAYLAEALAVIRERNGSIEAYLRDVLGVDAAMREALEARLLA